MVSSFCPKSLTFRVEVGGRGDGIEQRIRASLSRNSAQTGGGRGDLFSSGFNVLSRTDLESAGEVGVSVVCCLLSVVSCQLSVVCCLLSVVSCLSSVACWRERESCFSFYFF